MSRYYMCDECEVTSNSPLIFELTQTCEEIDEDGDPVIQITHFCSSSCLCNRAMTLAMDHREDIVELEE